MGFVVGGASESLGRLMHARAQVSPLLGTTKVTGGSISTVLIKGVPVSRSFLSGAAKTLKVGGVVLGGAGFAFIPGGGWIVAGAYFGGKALLEYTGNDIWNQ